MTSIRSRWAVTRPEINGEVQPGEWDDAEVLKVPELEHAIVYFKNDAENLYILFDVIEDTIEDEIGREDILWIAVDVDRSKNLTPGTDVLFQIGPYGRGFKKSYWPEPPETWGPPSDTVSEGAVGFGTSVNSATPHRIWEYALNLEEIGADPSTWWGSDDRPPVVRMGLQIRSLHPPFTDQIPVGPFTPDMNFADLLEVSLSTQPEFPARQLGPVFFGVGLIPYRKIDPGNGHATTTPPPGDPLPPLLVENWAFGGRLDVLGNIRDLWDVGVRHYKIKYSQDGGVEQDLRQTWSNYKREEVAAGVWEDVLYSIGPDEDGIYDLPDPTDDWLTANLLLRWQTRGFGGGNGLYTVRLELLPAAAGAAALAGVPAADQRLNLRIDNTQPTVDIDNMQHAGRDVGRCEIVRQGDTGFRFQITVDDPEGHLRWYRLNAHHGDPGESPATIAEVTYDSAVHGFRWDGVSEHWVPAGDATWSAGESCAYGFHLGADARITNGYSLHVYPYAWCSKYVTIQVGEITEQLLNEIETLDLRYPYEERICMSAVSKDLRGEFVVIEQEEQGCESPPCVTLKARLKIEAEVTPHDPCDAVAAFDGAISGELVFAHIESGEGRGYHLGKFEWAGAESKLIGRMSGVTNAGTHRSPANPCEPCDQRGHMEGRLDAVVVDGEFQGCRVLATYVMDYDTSHEAQDTGFVGTLEGVSICPCEG